MGEWLAVGAVKSEYIEIFGNTGLSGETEPTTVFTLILEIVEVLVVDTHLARHMRWGAQTPCVTYHIDGLQTERSRSDCYL